MNRITDRLAALLLVVAVLANPGASQTTKPEATEERWDAAPALTVLEPGAEPRRRLRLSPSVGEVQRERMTLTMSISQTMNGTAMPEQRSPAVTMDMMTRVDDVRDDGLIEYAFEYTDAGVEPKPGTPPQMAEMMKQAMQSISGTRGTVIVDRRGIMQETSTKLPDDIEPTARQQMEGMQSSFRQLSATLPEEAVGVGARWQVERRMTLNRMRITQTATYTVESIQGDALTLDVTVAHTAKPQKIQQQQADIEIESFSGEGTGRIRMSLASLLPTEARLMLIQKTTSRASFGDQEYDVEQTLNMEMTLSPIKEGAEE